MASSPDETDPRPTRPVDAVPRPPESEQPPRPSSPAKPRPETRPETGPGSGDGAATRRAPSRSTARSPAAKAPAEPKPKPVPRAPKPSPADRKPAATKPAPPPAATAASAFRQRRLRHTIQKVDLWSVLKLSLCFYLCGLAVTIVALISLWVTADAFGVVENVEEFVGELLSSNDFTFLSGEMLRGVALVGLVLVMLQVVVTVIAAAFYNLFAELFGGIEVTVVEDETPG